MYIISKQLKNQLSEFDMEFYGLIYYCTNEKCFIDGKIGIFIVVVRILAAQYARIVQVVMTVITVAGIGGILSLHCLILPAMFLLLCFTGFGAISTLARVLWFFLIMTTMTILFAFLLCFMFPYVLYDMIQPINNDLEGDWNTLICYLNCTTSARPINRTIL